MYSTSYDGSRKTGIHVVYAFETLRGNNSPKYSQFEAVPPIVLFDIPIIPDLVACTHSVHTVDDITATKALQ